MTDYLQGRQLAITDIPREKLNDQLGLLVKYLKKEWLEKEGNNPLQLLWKRSDVLATNELLNFANAICRIDKIDHNWLIGQLGQLKKYLQKTGLLTLKVVLIFKRYPSSNECDTVYTQILEAVKEFEKKGVVAPVSTEVLDLYVNFFSGYKFARGFHSYLFMAISPFYKNEKKNSLDKLDEACANLIQQRKIESDREINGIFIHLHEDALIDVCQEEIQNYLNERQDVPISFVYFYQSAVVRNKDQTSNVVHTIKTAINAPRYQRWIQKNGVNMPGFEFWIGEVSLESSKREIWIDNKRALKLNPANYIYQSGEIYQECIQGINGTIEGTLTNLASGVKLHMVAVMGGKRVLLKGRFPKDDYLAIT